MRLETTYTTPGLFTLGDLRAIVDQTKGMPEEVDVEIGGTRDTNGGDDVIAIIWEEA